MFSSNQKLKISGSLLMDNQLEECIAFAIKYDGRVHIFDKNEYRRGCRFIYQTTENKFCVGTCYGRIPEGWTEFKYIKSTEPIGKKAREFLAKYPKEAGSMDGGYEEGFLMEAIPETLASEYKGIKHPFYGIISIKPYTCFYAK